MEQQRTLLTDCIDLLRDSVRRVKRLYPFHIDAWVVWHYRGLANRQRLTRHPA